MLNCPAGPDADLFPPSSIIAMRNRWAAVERQRQVDRVNADYDQRIRDCCANKAINQYERDRRIRQAEEERGSKLKSFGTALAVGVVDAVILGSILAN